ncbi:trans-sialidase [Trypanosoma cruzi]|nr:trans-sialidase [Trypanosoma cruzi]
MQTASTSVRTSRVVPGHSCGTTRCEGTCYRSAGNTIYLGKHEGGQQRHNCACCSKSALMLFYFFGTGNWESAPCACCLRSHSHFLNGACCCFSEAGFVCQRDRETQLAVAGVPPGTALECRVPRVGLSPRRGRLSGIVSRLLLNAVVVVDGKSLMGEREIVCCRVISHSGTCWSDACVFASQIWCFGSLFHAIRCRRSGQRSDAVTSCAGVVGTVTRACGGPEQIQVYYAVWVYKKGRNSGRLRGVAMHAAAEDDMRC